MNLNTKSAGGLVALLLMSLVGCQKFNYEKSFTLAPMAVEGVAIDAPRSQQKVAVEVTSSGAPIHVHVVLEKEHATTLDALASGKKLDAAKVLANREGMESGTLEATVPAGSGYSVFVSGAKKQTSVKLKITGK